MHAILTSMTNTETEKMLRTIAGDGAYERGLEYFKSGNVGELATSGAKTVARVEGTELYTVTMHWTSRGFDGVCDCPASDGFDFCKHCVAVALTLAARDVELATLKTGSVEEQIRAFLLQQDKAYLIDSLMEAANNLPGLSQRLSLRAAAAAGQVGLKSLKKEITAASPRRNIWRRQEVYRYFERFEAVLESIVEVADDLPANDLLKLVEHAIDRLNKSLERVDDSGGSRWSVQHQINALNIKAISQMEWSIEQQAAHLLGQVLADPYDHFANFKHAYDELLGEQGWIAFYAQARKRLEALPPLEFDASFTEASEHISLCYLLTPWYEASGDISQMIAVMEISCHSATDCHNIAALYLSQGDTQQCGTWLAKGDAHLPAQRRTTELHVTYFEACGDPARASEIQHTMFRDQPSYASLKNLLRLAELADTYDQTQATALEFLHKQLQGHVYHSQTAAMILARMHHDLGDLDAAFDLLQSHVADESLLLEATGWFKDQPNRACALVKSAVEDCISGKNKRAYRRAADLLEQVARPQFNVLGTEAFDAYLMTLRESHRAKSSLMRVLDAKGL